MIFFEQGVDRMKNTIPGIRKNMPPSLTGFGKPRGVGNQVLNAANTFIFPGNINVLRKDKVSQEIEKIREETGESGVYPKSSAPWSIEFDSKTVRLTPDERREFQITRGKTSYEVVENLTKSNVYAKITSEQKSEGNKRRILLRHGKGKRKGVRL